ncbi:regulatory protein RecX [Aurantiacibacter sp. MUD11]|uniref:regulatory protein RecX n=1 Tax=Aurantiacibacter sp. MUD11 TaxID=3003265 RepID=UPI0022AAE501|nr:regulatory protein RecX [Aurantiacibacter sp. MUD11]WAT17487.1 regulatory protein RecX [Aurantiacibacter sp. MUD11]
MEGNRQECKREKRTKKPLDSTQLNDLALAYVARFATSAAKLERYLHRKLRERGWDGEDEPDVESLVNRYVERGYVDDEVYARAKAGDLLRRGYGGRRVKQALGQAGISGQVAEEAAPSEHAARMAALHMARKRGFGPFAVAEVPPEKREKHIAAMLRAGHKFDHVRTVLDSEDEVAAEQWVDEAAEDASGDGYV